ncbi:glycosyltransferase family 4 protein [Demequina sediminicola]|uniref:glycosyltransferase family 4 protein n=1 Tax=Demequina sediminicola TaxID=1095026 RepID=UPI000781D625|nr:glycosyltransferase family 4 protein [Demequina sediminicola]
MKIVLAAPVSVSDCAGLLDDSDAQRALAQPGNYGAAPTRLALALHDAGHDVSVVTHRRGHGNLELAGSRFRYIQVPSRSSARSQAVDGWRHERRLMVSAITELAPEIVHSHWTYEWALAGISSGLPHVTTARDAPTTILRHHRDAYRALRWLMAAQFRMRARSTSLATPSPYLAERWRTEMRWTRDITVLPNIAPGAPTAHVATANHPTLVEVADAGPRKNIRGLLQAFADVRRTTPDAELRLVGPGLGEGDGLARSAREAGLANGVTFVGPLEPSDVQTELMQAWAHVHAALEESFGNTLVEAMAMGTPVIAGEAAGAAPWVLGDAGLVCDVSNPAKLASAMVSLLEDSSRRNELHALGLKEIDERFSAHALALAHQEFYERAIG